ncbi:MAG: hypothetical protein ABSF13_02685 [Smithella sp.]|jgi:hypothetical protein
MDNEFWAFVSKKAEETFIRPKRLYPWDSIVQGVTVCKSDGTSERMYAVAKNTWRAHHRKDTSRTGSSKIFMDFFSNNQNKMLNDLQGVKNRSNLHEVANFWVSEIRPKLSNVKTHILNSYNSIRKPIDLYFYNLVSMAVEVPNETRLFLIPILFLPVDSQILGIFSLERNQEFGIFSYNQLRILGLTHQSSYGHVKTESTYNKLQDIITIRAKELSECCSAPFYPIYFEMLWNERYKRTGGNIFELNP